jgi:hypothetical protein
MSVFSFTMTIEGADLLTDEAQDALFEAGCGDATFGTSKGVQLAEFDRDARDFADVVASAIKAIEGAVNGAHVVSVIRDRDQPAAG